MVRPNPVETCPQCGSAVTADMVTGGGKLAHVPVWRFSCPKCGQQWAKVVSPPDVEPAFGEFGTPYPWGQNGGKGGSSGFGERPKGR
jgi:predicted RNA-binding Zn-ribbon protein involved in translation (DUF1610 family)